MADSPAEALAKSAVVDFIRRSRRTPSLRILSELPLPQFGIRADLVVCGRTPIAVEIKTARDSLARLERQSRALCHAFPNVYFAVSPNHLPKVLSKTSDGVGVLVLEEERAILVKRPAPSSAYSPAIAIEIIPTKMLAKWLGCPVRTARADLIAAMRRKSQAEQKKSVHWFLDQKWSQITNSSQIISGNGLIVSKAETAIQSSDYYGQDFGLVPDYLRLRVKA